MARFIIKNAQGLFFTEVTGSEMRPMAVPGDLSRNDLYQHPTEFEFGTAKEIGAAKFDTQADALAFAAAHNMTDVSVISTEK